MINLTKSDNNPSSWLTTHANANANSNSISFSNERQSQLYLKEEYKKVRKWRKELVRVCCDDRVQRFGS